MTKSDSFLIRRDRETAETIKKFSQFKNIPISHLYNQGMLELIKKSSFSDEKLKKSIKEIERKQKLKENFIKKKEEANLIFQFNNGRERIYSEFARDMRFNNEPNYKKYVFLIMPYIKMYKHFPEKIKKILKKDYLELKKLKDHKKMGEIFKIVQESNESSMKRAGQIIKRNLSTEKGVLNIPCGTMEEARANRGENNENKNIS